MTTLPPRRDHRRPRLRAAGPADQCGTGAHGRHHAMPGSPSAPASRSATSSRARGSAPRIWARKPCAACLQKTGTKPEDIDLLICATTTPDMRVPVDRQSDLRHGRHPQRRLVRRAGGLLGLPLFADRSRAQFIADRHRTQGRRGRRRQDVVDHRLHRPRHLRAVRRRRRRGAARAERRRLRHHGHADPLRRLRHDPSASEGRRQPHAADAPRRSPSACITSIRKAPRFTSSPSPRWRRWRARSWRATICAAT